MHLIAKEVERRKLSFKSLRAIQLTSEPVPPAFRARLQSIFNCEIYDKYGSRETNIVSHESPAHDGMLIQQENVFVEILDGNDQPCPAGVDGRIVLTTLNNFAMPLIRYETSDISSFIAGTSAKLPAFTRMSSVAGRLQDLIVTPNGDHVDAYFFSYLLMRFNEVDWFQIIQPDLNTLHIKLYCPRGIGDHTLNAIRERIFHHCNCEFALSFEQLNSMPSSPTGKFRLCISELGQQATTLAGPRLVING
jgi:phenylacetate-CoA ligase